MLKKIFSNSNSNNDTFIYYGDEPLVSPKEENKEIESLTNKLELQNKKLEKQKNIVNKLRTKIHKLKRREKYIYKNLKRERKITNRIREIIQENNIGE